MGENKFIILDFGLILSSIGVTGKDGPESVLDFSGGGFQRRSGDEVFVRRNFILIDFRIVDVVKEGDQFRV